MRILFLLLLTLFLISCSKVTRETESENINIQDSVLTEVAILRIKALMSFKSSLGTSTMKKTTLSRLTSTSTFFELMESIIRSN